MSNRDDIKKQIRKISEKYNLKRPSFNNSTEFLEEWLGKVRKKLLKKFAKRRASKALKLAMLRRIKLARRIRALEFLPLLQDVLTGKRYTATEASKIINAMINDGRYIISINDIDFPLNTNTKEIVKEFLMNGSILEEIPGQGSDRMYEAFINGIVSINFRKLPEIATPDQDGAYFPRVNIADKKGSKNLTYINLSRYQIFPTTRPTENCLIHTLSLIPSVSEEKINAVKLSLTTGSSISKKDLKTVAEILEKTIILRYFKDDRQQTQKFGNFEESIDIAIYMNHYFIFEDTKYTPYSIKNYEALKSKKEWWDLYKKDKRSETLSKLSSLKLVHLMSELDFFIFSDMSTSAEGAEHIETRDRIFLENIHNEQRLIEPLELKENTSDIYYADFETFTPGNVHKMFLLGCVSRKSDNVDIWNVKDFTDPQYLIYKFLSKLTSDGTKPATCYFHNLKYDYNIMEKYLNISSVCKKNNQLYNVVCYYKNQRIEFRDSFKLISIALHNFQKNFDLDKEFAKLEAINYDYYTEENNGKLCTREEYARGLPDNEKKIFYETVLTESFNPTEYYINYLKMDCLVLKKGLEKFNDLVTGDISDKLSIYNSLTISSLTDKYMHINGAYEGVYENTANLRDYIGRAVYGGRVHVNEKYKKQVVEEKIADYDGVSLYPSAIDRLCREIGLPKGSAKRYTSSCTGIEPDGFSPTYAIYTVRITSVNKTQQMPFIAVKSTDSLDYVNEPPTNTDGSAFSEIQIDNITLEDYIKFHDIEYEILDGVYWDEGGNKKMGELINKLFKLRLENKKTKPALANILKLMLNSAYGKTIMKKSTSKTRIVKKDKHTLEKGKWKSEENKAYEDFVYKNFNTLKTTRKISDKIYEVDQLCIDDSYNRGHIGCSILSMSKRIMNEVFDIANTQKINIYYQDTDSMHMPYDAVPILEKAFYEEYKRELTGTNLGQFHIDFDLDGSAEEVYSTKAIFLGKKSYIDHLESKDQDGNLIQGHHIRLKGITKQSIDYHGGSEPFEMFESLAKGKPLTMILNPFIESSVKQKPMFEYVEGGVRTRKSNEFIRKIQF